MKNKNNPISPVVSFSSTLDGPFIDLGYYGASAYAAAWTPSAARPEGSGFLDHVASHSTAFAVLHATLGPPGTVCLAAFCSNDSTSLERGFDKILNL